MTVSNCDEFYNWYEFENDQQKISVYLPQKKKMKTQLIHIKLVQLRAICYIRAT